MGALSEAETEAVTNVSLHTAKPFKMAKVIENLVKLRNDGDRYHQQIEVGGRKRLYSLLADVYAIYYDSKEQGQAVALREEVVAKLKALTPPIELSATADISNVLIRFVFVSENEETQLGTSDKQVSIWARALRVVYDRQKPAIVPSMFVDTVEKQEGGISGFKEAPKSGASTTEPLTPKTAFSKVENLEPMLVVDDIDWAVGEEYRVLIAVPGEDDNTKLIHLPLSKEQSDALLVGYVRTKEAADRAIKSALPPAQKIAKLQLQKAKNDAEMALAVAENALHVAVTAAPKADHSALKSAVELAKADFDVAKEAAKQATNKKKKK